MAVQKFVVRKTEDSQIGNSISWRYAYGEWLEIWHVDHPDWSFQVEGNWENKLVGFDACGDASRFLGELKPPKNPARAVFWRQGIYIPKAFFHYNLDDTEMEKVKASFYDRDFEDREWVQKRVPGSSWFNVDFMFIPDNIVSSQTCAMVFLERRWDTPFEIKEIYFRKGCNLSYAADKILDRFLKSYRR
jgi:hypothetical protein